MNKESDALLDSEDEKTLVAADANNASAEFVEDSDLLLAAEMSPTPESASEIKAAPELFIEPELVSEPAFEPELSIPSHLDTITPEMEHRAKRTRFVLIVVILLLILTIGGLGVIGYFLIFQDPQGGVATVVDKTSVAIDTSNIKDTDAAEVVSSKTTTMPNLTSLFGLTISEIQTRLPGDFILTKTEETSDQSNSAIKTLSTFSYSPKSTAAGSGAGSAPTAGSSQVESLYVSLDESGKAIELYYVCSLDLLGYPESTFARLTSTVEMTNNILKTAGVLPTASWEYKAPVAEEYTQYVDPEATEKKVKKETATFYSTIDSESAPTNWNLTLTYDYGASGIVASDTMKPNQRMLYLKLY